MKFRFAILALSIAIASNGQPGDFPAAWQGNWKGNLQWYKTGKAEPQLINMELKIAMTDSPGIYTWQIIYGEAGQDTRPYLLKPKEAAKGHWVIDEQNGIILDQFWVGNKFCGAFTVMGNTIINSYRMEKDQLTVEFYGIAAKPIVTSGKGTEQSPYVDSYRVGSYQHVILTKQ